MRTVLFVIAILFSFGAAFASEIREFSVPTLERLGNELSHRDAIAERASEIVLRTQPAARALKARGWPPNIAVRYKARETAFEAVKSRLFNISYSFEVLNDPDGDGFLVYALGSTGKAGQVVLGGHVRVSVSADASTVKRVDPLSRTLMIEDEKHTGLPKGTHLVASNYNQIVSNKPVETLIYTSRLSGRPIFVQTPDGKMWQVANGRMFIDKSKPGSDSMGGAARRAFNENGR